MHAVAAFFASIITFVSGLFGSPLLATNSPANVPTIQPAAAAAAQTEIVGDPFNDPAAASSVASASAMPPAPAFSPPPAQTIINQPVIERIIERVMPQGDSLISADTLAAILADFGRSIEKRIAAINPPKAAIPEQVAAAGNSSSYYFVPASQRIDQLSNTTINNPTISGGSISGTSITGTITNAIDTALATIDDLTSNTVTATNAVYTNATTTHLSVTNLAATATSSLSGLKLAGTDCAAYGNGGKLTTDAFGNVTCAADQGGAGGSVGGLNTQVQFNDGGVFGGNAGFTYDKTAQRVAVAYASTTGVTASYASSTQGFFGTLSAGSLSLTTPLSAVNGGTGIGNPASAGILVGSYGGGSWQQLATSSLGLLTSDIAEETNLYWTNTRFDARLAATTSLPMLTTLANLTSIGTITNGVWNGSTIGTPYGGTGSTTLSGILKGNGASAVQTALPGTDYELPLSFNAPLSRVGNAVSLSTAGDWSGTLGGFSAAQLTAAGFSTTSADAWKSARSFFATSSSDYWLSTKTTDNLAQGSSNKYYATSLFAADLAATTTSALAEGSNLYFTNNRVAGIIAGTTTDALSEGSTRLYFTNARADQRINATSTIGTLTSAPNLATISTSLTGFLKATAGAIATSLVNLASDVTGILPVANGGTGWASIAAGAIPYGNGSSALATTSTGTAGQVLAFLNGVPTWTATTTFSAPLSYANGAVSLAQANGGTNGYLAAADWTLFSGKISSSSLSAVYPLAYNSATGIFSSAFSTTTNNTFSGTNVFNGQTTLANASTTNLTASGTVFASAASTTNLLIDQGATTSALYIASTVYGAGLTNCSGSGDKLLWDSTTRQFTCGGDAGAGGGITALKGEYSSAQNGATQTFATSSDANLLLTITSSGDTHTFASAWTGTLAASRGGTGTSTPAALGNVLYWNGANWQGLATSSLGITSAWGSITGTLSNQTDLQSALDDKLSLSSWYATTTSALAEGSNLYFTNNRVAGVIAGTTTDALSEGSTRLYFTNARVQTYLDTLAKGYFFSTTSADYWKTQTAFTGASTTLLADRNTWTGLNTFSNTTTTLATLGNAWFTGITSSRLLALDENGKLAATTTIGTNLLAGVLSVSKGGTGTSTNAAYGNVLAWNGSNYQGFATSTLGLSTTNILEGANLYFTNARADQRINATSTIGTLTSAPNLATISTSLTGFLKATAGSLSTSLINLASDITGTLGVANGGTGWASIAAGAIPYGNGSSALATSSALSFDGTKLSATYASSTAFSVSGTAYFPGSGIWNSSGNVGIGTTTPGSLLSLNNIANFTAATSTFYSTGGINLAAGCFAISGNCLSFTNLVGTLGIAQGGTGTTTQVTNGVTYFDGAKITSGTGFIFNGTNVGIGTTNPSYKLDVNGFINTDQSSGYKQAGYTVLYASTTNAALALGASGAAAWMNASSTVWASLAVGSGALATAPTSGASQYNTAVGTNSLYSNQTGANQTALGHAALFSNTTGHGNTALGVGTLQSNTTGFFSTAIGVNALNANTTGLEGLAIGFTTLASNTTGSFNVAIGNASMLQSTIGAQNVGLGHHTLYYATSSNYTVAIGNRAFEGTAAYANQGSTAVGFEAGLNVTNGADFNTLLGHQAGYDVTSGWGNIVLGASTSTGSGITTGSNNILIGNGVRAGLSQTGSNQLNIGNLIFGTGLGSGSALSTGNIGIGTTTPWGKLSITGSGTGTGLAFAVADSANTPRFVIQDNGNVGIGTTSPATTLSVSGSGYLTGGLGVGLLNTTAGTLQTSGAATIGGTLTASGGVVFNPPSGMGYGLLQTQTVSGTNTSGVNANLINISDSAAITGGGFVNEFTVQTTLNSANVQGGRQGTFSLLNFNNPTSASNPNRNYVASAFNVTTNAGDNGTDTGAGAKGAFFGINPVAIAQSGATNLLTLTGGEINIAAQAGSSLSHKFGLTITSLGSDAVNGTNYDAMLGLTDQAGSVGWRDGILFSAANSKYPISSSGTLIRSTAATVTNGVDFSAVTFTGCAFKASAFCVSGDGHNVSIGTTTPNDVTNFSTLTLNNTTGGIIDFTISGPLYARIKTDYVNGLSLNSVAALPMIFSTNNTERMRITSTGNVGIGTTSPTAQLHTTGTVRFSNFGAGTLTTDASGNLSVSSDERLKNIDGAFTRGLADVLKLSPINYHWNPLSGLDTSTQYAGFSAQNVQQAIPEAVGSSANGFLSLQDRPLIAAVVNAIKELSAKLDTLATHVSGFAESFTTRELVAINGDFHRVTTGELCARKADNTAVCVTGDQLAALLGQSAATALTAAPVTSIAPQSPVIELNGNATSTISLGAAYNDLGARIVAPENDLNLGIVILLDGATTTQVSIDTSTPGEHTILYTVTSPITGLTGSVVRTIIVRAAADFGMVSQPQDAPEPPTDEAQQLVNDNPFNPEPADNPFYPVPENDNNTAPSIAI